MNSTPIEILKEQLNHNVFYMKREDLLPFSFGGNKARKAEKFRKDIIEKKADVIVTYGSSSSNHCRIIANMAKALGVKCYIISPSEHYEETYNSQLIQMFGAEIIKVPVNEVSKTIDDLMQKLSKEYHPYFIPGGGHGNLGTEAYVEAFDEITSYEKEKGFSFDYVFFASGTGTTHAGLVCGQILHEDYDKKIVGISIARKKERGRQIVIESIEEYLKKPIDSKDELVIFEDKYTGEGYNASNEEIYQTIKNVLFEDGIALNSTYTGKAYFGMLEYIKEHEIKDKKILFINTGGLPLFFDDMEVLTK